MTDSTVKVIIEDAKKETSDTPNPNLTNEEVKPQSTNSEAWAVASYAASQVTSLVSQAANYTYSKYIQLTENYVAQNSVVEATSIINGFSSVISSAANGGMFGPVGAAIGAVAGVVNLGVQVFQNYENAYETLDQKAYDKYYQGSRYGLINGNRGTDN